MTNWINHKKHREQVIQDEGRWIGLLDENGEPLIDLPPIITMKAAEKVVEHR